MQSTSEPQQDFGDISASHMVVLSEFARSKHARRILAVMAAVGLAAVVWSSALTKPPVQPPLAIGGPTQVAIFTAGVLASICQFAVPARKTSDTVLLDKARLHLLLAATGGAPVDVAISRRQRIATLSHFTAAHNEAAHR